MERVCDGDGDASVAAASRHVDFFSPLPFSSLVPLNWTQALGMWFYCKVIEQIARIPPRQLVLRALDMHWPTMGP